MKRIQTTITEEFDKDNKIIRRITETVEEEDNASTIYPNMPYIPYIPSSPTIPQYPWYVQTTTTGIVDNTKSE